MLGEAAGTRARVNQAVASYEADRQAEEEEQQVRELAAMDEVLQQLATGEAGTVLAAASAYEAERRAEAELELLLLLELLLPPPAPRGGARPLPLPARPRP